MSEPFLADLDLTLYVGDALEQLREIADASVHCCVTSPPYWGLRDYGTGTWEGGDPDCQHPHPKAGDIDRNIATSGLEGAKQSHQHNGARAICGLCGATRIDQQLGLEQSPDEYVEKVVEIFREVRRVLRADGTCWLNIGDSYAQYDGGSYAADTRAPGQHGSFHLSRRGREIAESKEPRSLPAGFKRKDLIGIPWRLAFALQDDGWYLRSDVIEEVELYCPCGCGHVLEERVWRYSQDRDLIWRKSNPMPESVTDRPTKSHEYVFLLTKSQRYFYDAAAIAEPATWWGPNGNPKNGPHAQQMQGRAAAKHPQQRRAAELDEQHGLTDDIEATNGASLSPLTRNARSVWTVATQQFADAHFATFPEELPRRCIAAGTSEYGCCPQCGAPWQRIIETNNPSKYAADDDTRGWANTHSQTSNAQSSKSLHRNEGGVYSTAVFKGWRPSCACAGVDLTPIMTPLGESDGADPTMETGRKGLGRPRGDGEGTRPITRYEQAEYARQLRQSAFAEEMRDEAGAEAFAHYVRTDASGARPIPPELLERWIENEWLERVEIPETAPLTPVPCTVLDPFMGSGTTALVARKMGRRCVGIELNQEYAELVAQRTQQLSIFA